MTSAGEISGFGCVARDLTERKLVEQEGSSSRS